MWYSTIFKRFANPYYSGWAKAGWIDPSGEYHDTEGDTHQGWMFSNRQYVDGEHRIFTDMEEKMRDEQNALTEQEIARLTQEIQDAENDPELSDYVGRCREDLEIFQNSIDDIDYSNFNISEMVTRLIQHGWVRFVDKHGKLHYEYDSDEQLPLIEMHIKNLLGIRPSMNAQVILEPLNNTTLGFSIQDWLQSGLDLLTWVQSEPDELSFERRSLWR